MATSASLVNHAIRREPSRESGSSTILIVDDHPLTRDGLRRLLAEDEQLSVCGEAATVNDARRLISELQPDLVLLDFDLPDGDCFTLVKELRQQQNSPKIIVLCGWSPPPDADATALRLGASAFLSKQATGNDVLRVIRDALQGRAYLSPEMIARLLSKRSR